MCSANVFFLSFFLFSGPFSLPVISEITGPNFTKFLGMVVPWKGFHKRSLAICRPGGCTLVSDVVVVVVVVVGVCNRSQMRTNKCICLNFGVIIGLDPS